MAKYRVTVHEIHAQDYIVEADTAEEAWISAEESGEQDEGNFHYVRSMGVMHMEEIKDGE